MRSPGTNHGLLVYALALVVAVAFCSMSASAQERITDFSSDITVSSSGTLTVKETIAVHAEGRAIRHGIYRDLPGFPLFSRFNVEQVQRDGHAEPYAVKWTWSGRHVRIGDANVDVPIGEHTYVIVYTTGREIGFFDDFDELYWNVTGNGWAFPIAHAEATVRLPPGASIKHYATYTGLKGARGRNASADQNGPRIRFFTTQPLPQSEGLTFALDFSKTVTRPFNPIRTALEYLRANSALLPPVPDFLRADPAIGSSMSGLIVLGLYFLGAWLWFGRDPAHGLIVPQFSAPRNLCAASVRFIRKMGFDSKCIAAALIGLAVKGFLKIRYEQKKYILTWTGKSPVETGLSAPEAEFGNTLFEARDEISLEVNRSASRAQPMFCKAVLGARRKAVTS